MEATEGIYRERIASVSPQFVNHAALAASRKASSPVLLIEL
jgi:hypothetical protein